MQLKKAKEGFLPVWILLAVFFVLIVVVLALYFISAAGLPDNVGRILSEEEQIEVIERNSPLTEYVYLTKNADFPRNRENYNSSYGGKFQFRETGRFVCAER